MSEIRIMTDEEVAEYYAECIRLDSNDIKRINALLRELELADISIKEFVDSLKDDSHE